MEFNEARQRIAKALHENYKHKEMHGIACSICGRTDKSLATQTFVLRQESHLIFPDGFIIQNKWDTDVRGTFPICTDCARPCRKCELPITSKKLIKYYNKIKSENPEATVMWLNGICIKDLHIFGIDI